MKVVKKPAKPPKRIPARPKAWRDVLRRLISKVPEVDAIYVSAHGTYVHVYSVIEDFDEDVCTRLFKQEALFEKLFPRHYFEFHTRVHRGKKPTGKEQYTSELVFLRDE